MRSFFIAMYDIIYADPPWKYDFSASQSREIENHYSTMSIEEICAFDFPRKRNSVLYLWATAPKIRLAFQVIDAWGYEYKTQAVWNKINFGMGYWFRGQHEILLVATSGKFCPPFPEHRRRSIITAKRGKHSRKPEEVYKMIEESFPRAKKLELFARVRRDGWDARGKDLK